MGTDNTDATACDVAEADVEATELAAYIVVPVNTWCEEPMTELCTNDEEQAERLLRVLHLGEEVRCETERQRNLRRLVKVRLQDVPATRVSIPAPTADEDRLTC